MDDEIFASLDARPNAAPPPPRATLICSLSPLEAKAVRRAVIKYRGANGSEECAELLMFALEMVLPAHELDTLRKAVANGEVIAIRECPNAERFVRPD